MGLGGPEGYGCTMRVKAGCEWGWVWATARCEEGVRGGSIRSG